jgi:hypothetical protein
MAKIFSRIAQNKKGLANVYDDSSVNNDLKTFLSLRSEVSNTLGVPSTLLVTNRPKKVYDTYTDPRNITTPVVKIYQESNLITPEQVVRTRRSSFYDAFRTVNTTLTISNPAINGTLVEIKPYTPVDNDEIYSVETSRILQNSQSTPIVSGPRDVVRMRKYLNSGEGTNFKTFQQVLQAGTTFGQARGYNPISVETMVLNYSNATLFNPLTRVSRILNSGAISNPNLWGRLQKETVIDTQSKLRLKFVGGSSTSIQSPVAAAINNQISAFLKDRINSINITLPRFLGGRQVNVGQVNRQLDALNQSAEAIRRGLNTSNSTLTKDQTAYDSLYANNLWPMMKDNDGTIKNFQGPRGEKESYIARARQAVKKIKNINDVNKNTEAYPTDDYRSSATYTEDMRGGSGTGTSNGLVSAKYVKDPFNTVNGRTILDAKDLDGVEDKDYITFKIAVPGVFARGIQFRAFIEDFNHNARGQYNEVRYVGRPERFVTYNGMNRSMTFSLYLVAYSQDELETIWTRANMLNKLVYPIDNSGGFMTPPLARITIGKIITDQPGYVENVDMRLQDTPWDIDSELTQVIKLNMTYNIIEKVYIQQTDTDPSSYIQLFNEKPITNPPRFTQPYQYNQTATSPINTATQPVARTTTPNTGVGGGVERRSSTNLLNGALAYPGIQADNTRVLANQEGYLTAQGLLEQNKIDFRNRGGFGGGGGFSGAGAGSRIP